MDESERGAYSRDMTDTRAVLDDTKTYMTRKEASDYLGVHLRTIDRYTREGVLTKYGMRWHVRLLRSEVAALGEVQRIC
jgi:excisionase family DNA binding protein